MNNNALPLILEHMTAVPWAMDRTTLGNMVNIVTRHISGVRLSEADIDAATNGRKRSADQGFRIESAAAVIPVSGVIAKYARQVNGSSQPRGTSVETLSKTLDKALADDRAKRIFLDIESPGGSVAGLADFADLVFQANQVKPVIAFANDMCASGGYWIGSQASRFYANQTAIVGSIGVYSLMLDSSRAAESEGYHFIIVRSGDNKGVGNMGIPITDANIAQYQTEIDKYFELFTAAVMRGRGPRGLTEDALSEIADGRCLIGSDAADANLVDGIMTFRQALTSALPKVESIRADSNNKTNTASSQSEDLNLADNCSNGNENNKTQSDEVTGAQKMVDKATPDAAAIEAATKKEQTRCMAVAKVLAGHDDLLATAMADPACTETKATAMLVPVLQAEIKTANETIAARDATLAEIQKGNKQVATGEAEEEPDPKTKAEKAAEKAKAENTEFENCVTELTAGENAMSVAAAQIEAAKRHPEGHAEWLEKENNKRNKNVRSR